MIWILNMIVSANLRRVSLGISANGRGYEQLSVACAMERIAYSLCYVGAMAVCMAVFIFKIKKAMAKYTFIEFLAAINALNKTKS